MPEPTLEDLDFLTCMVQDVVHTVILYKDPVLRDRARKHEFSDRCWCRPDINRVCPECVELWRVGDERAKLCRRCLGRGVLPYVDGDAIVEGTVLQVVHPLAPPEE